MSTLDVLVGETPVGSLEQFEDERYIFSFAPGWLEDPDRPVLGQYFEDQRPRDVEFWGPPCWFAHLLPQGPVRRAIARVAGLDEGDVFELLRLYGDDLPGAVVVRPGTSRWPHARARVTAARPATLQMTGALAGAQWKLSLREDDRGLVIPVGGESGSWIAKFHDPVLAELPRVEFATASWARASGIDVPAVRLGRAEEVLALPPGIPTGDGTVYLIERFDRQPNGPRIHMEDFGQVLDRPPGQAQFSGNVELIAAVIAALAPIDLKQLCERLVFCVLCGNGDAHLKNWSLLYPDGRNARLSPAYDLVSTVVYPQLDDWMALPIGGSARFEDVHVASFTRLAQVSGVPFSEVEAWVTDAVARIRGAWTDQAAAWPFTAEERARLQAHLRRVPLAG